MTYTRETRFKWLGEGGKAHHGGSGSWPLPKNGKPGYWVKVKGKIVPCKNGVHTVDAGHGLIAWCAPGLWTAEAAGQEVVSSDKFCSRRGRLLQYVETWDDKTARLFAADCAERALKRVKVTDERSWAAVEAAREFARGEITRGKLDAAWAATRDATWAAARAAARDAARAAAWDAAWAAARDAARAATRDATWAATGDATWAATWAATRDAARDATWAAETKWQTDKLLQYLNSEIK